MAKIKNFVMIAPHFPDNFSTFALRLKEAGFNTLGIADVEYDELSPEVRDNLVEYYKVDDMEDYAQMYKAVAYFAFEYGKIDRIESHNEHWLELDARLRTDFNVFGFQTADIERIKYKSKMKEVFRSLGLKVAGGRVFKDEDDAIKLAKTLKYPVIIKPDNGVGASDTYKINDEAELKRFFDNYNPDVEYIMESFIEGDIVTFDGLADHNGRVVFSSSIIHKENVLDTVVKDADLYYYIPRTIDSKLRKIGLAVAKAFNVRERFFHFEFFKTASDEYIPLEVNMRPPGGLTIDMFNYANDFDIFAEYANIVKGDKFKAKLVRPYFCAYVSRKDNFDYVYSHEDIVNTLGDDFISVQSVPGVFSAIMGDEGYLLKCTTKTVLDKYIDFISKKIEG